MKIVSINIERDLHKEAVTRFLEEEKPVFLSLLEVYEEDARSYADLLGMKFVFAHQCYYPTKDGELKLLGVAVLYSGEALLSDVYYYGGDKFLRPVFQASSNLKEMPHILCSPVVVVKVNKEGQEYVFGATHLPVTPEGISTDFQKNYAKTLLGYLKSFPDLILCGDFNAPRGLETFSYFTEAYRDNIPLEHKTSLSSLHKADPKDLVEQAEKMGFPGYMVDGLFTTSGYKVTNVKLIDHVSDHMAVVGEVEKV